MVEEIERNHFIYKENALKFIGNGSAFNTELGNNSAYYIEGNNLFLIDCGSTTFSRIQEMNLLKGIEKVFILITHTHSDHVGSLGDLILYTYYSMGKMFERKAVIIAPEELEIRSLLDTFGVGRHMYKLIQPEDEDTFVYLLGEGLEVMIRPVKVQHVKNLNCFGFYIWLEYIDTTIYYSGDSVDIPPSVILDMKDEFLDYMYQDTCGANFPGNVHLSLNHLSKAIEDKKVRDRVHCMHLDQSFDIDKAKKLGFRVTEVEKVGK
mgnify:CR=1 FL=1